MARSIAQAWRLQTRCCKPAHPGLRGIGHQGQRQQELIVQARALAVAVFQRCIQPAGSKVGRPDTGGDVQRDLRMLAREVRQARNEPMHAQRRGHRQGQRPTPPLQRHHTRGGAFQAGQRRAHLEQIGLAGVSQAQRIALPHEERRAQAGRGFQAQQRGGGRQSAHAAMVHENSSCLHRECLFGVAALWHDIAGTTTQSPP